MGSTLVRFLKENETQELFGELFDVAKYIAIEFIAYWRRGKVQLTSFPVTDVVKAMQPRFVKHCDDNKDRVERNLGLEK